MRIILISLLFAVSLMGKELLINKIAIRINGQPVTIFDMKKELNPSTPEKISLKQIQNSKKESVDKVVASIIINQAIKKKNLSPSKNDIEKAIKNVAAQNKIPVEKLKSEIEAQGMNWDKYKNVIVSKQLSLLQLKRAVAYKMLDATESILRSMYKKSYSHQTFEFTVSHIIIKAGKDMDQMAFKKISGIHSQISSGTISFEDAAKTNSQDGSAVNGGKLGTFSEKQMVPEFSNELKKMSPGDISKPFLTRFGWHIVKLEKATKKDPESFENVKNQIKQEYYIQNQEKAFKSWMKLEKDNSTIEVLF